MKFIVDDTECMYCHGKGYVFDYTSAAREIPKKTCPDCDGSRCNTAEVRIIKNYARELVQIQHQMIR